MSGCGRSACWSSPQSALVAIALFLALLLPGYVSPGRRSSSVIGGFAGDKNARAGDYQILVHAS
jgi:hypothetical protein